MAFHYIQNIIPLPYHSLEGPLWYKPSLPLRQSLPCLVLLTALRTRSPFSTSISTVCFSSSGLLHLHIPLPGSSSSQIFVFLFYSDFHSNITSSRRKPHACRVGTVLSHSDSPFGPKHSALSFLGKRIASFKLCSLLGVASAGGGGAGGTWLLCFSSENSSNGHHSPRVPHGTH